MEMKKLLLVLRRIFLTILKVLLVPIIIYLIIMKVPIAINTDSFEPLLYETDMFNFVYEGKLYANRQNENIFKSLEEAGIKSEIPLGYSMDTGEKHRFISNAYEGYYLEYIYDGNVKRVYPSRFKKIDDFINPEEYLIIGDYYLLFLGQRFMTTSGQSLFTNCTIQMPEMKRENIEKIEQCIGIPDYSYSSENCEKFIDDLKSEHDRYIVQRKDIFDSDFIGKLADEFRRKGHIDGIVDAASEENKQIIKEAQAKVDSDPENEYKVKVYYKIYFKDDKFPFRLILTKTMWSRDELIP